MLACLVVGTGVVWVKRQRLFGPAFVGNGVVSVKRRAVQVCCVMAGLPGDVQGSSLWLLRRIVRFLKGVIMSAYFRPWNVDSMAEVIEKKKNGDIVIAYEHAPTVRHTLERRVIDKIGRFVDRADFRPVAA